MSSSSVMSRILAVFSGFVCLAAFSIGCAQSDRGPDDRSTANKTAGDKAGLTGQNSGKSANQSSNQGTSKVCGRKAVPSPAVLPGHPCDQGDLVVDETVQRTRGRPDEKTATFQISNASEICLSVPDSSAHAAWVFVDGKRQIGPGDFARSNGQPQETLKLSAGSHTVSVKLASRAGTKVDLEVRAAETPKSTQPTTTSTNGLLTLENIAVDHPMFSPDGDGYHDTVLFNADVVPKRYLERTHRNYRLKWSWKLIDAESCDTVNVDLSGSKPLDSTTQVRTHWDGIKDSGVRIGGGKYLYEYSVDLVRSDGRVVDSATAVSRGLLVKSSPASGLATLESNGTCDPETDPHDCKCPEETPDGTRCTFAWIPYLTSFEDPSNVETSEFITTHTDGETGRTEVVVDLREFNGGGLVPQHEGSYENLEELQQYVYELTGVEPDPDNIRLFNFDYVQLGYSTPVVRKEGAVSGFNHFLLDVITDASGKLTIGDTTYNVAEMLTSGSSPIPPEFEIHHRHEGDWCAENGNTDGEHSLQAKSCTRVRTANLDPGETDLGIYTLQWNMFDVVVDEQSTTQDEHCIINGIFKCGVRTFQRDAELTAAGTQYVEYTAESGEAVREVSTRPGATPSLVVHTDRHFMQNGELEPIDGVCSQSFATANDMSTPLDSAAGAVSDACIINGIF